MVLESLINPLKAEKSPWELFFIGFVYTTVAIFLSIWVFKNQSGLVSVFFVVMAALPLFYHTMILEESKDLKIFKEWRLLREHSKALWFFIFFFLGCTVAYTIWYSVFSDNVTMEVFRIQTDTIAEINSNVVAVTGLSFANSFKVFLSIFANNVSVMVFSMFFSFVYGAGALFILSWNASVIGVAFGSFIKFQVLHLSSSATSFVYFKAACLSLFRYLIHGIPEISAYFIAGLAGGIFSVAIIQRNFGAKNIERVILDCAVLMLVAFAVVFVAGIIEVYVTPFVFRNVGFSVCT